MNKIKNICFLDDDNYFLENRNIYLNPKTKSFKFEKNYYEIPSPDKNKLNDAFRAKWNFDINEWEYEDTKKKNLSISDSKNPMYFFRLAREIRLDEIDDYILKQVDNYDYEIDPKLLEYKEELVNLPRLIEENKIKMPEIKSDVSLYINTKNPEDVIDFEWPQYTFKD